MNQEMSWITTYQGGSSGWEEIKGNEVFLFQKNSTIKYRVSGEIIDIIKWWN